VKISFNGVSRRSEFFEQNTGYGKLFGKLFEALKQTHYEVVLNDSTAPVAICCENPGWLYREPGQYTIGYTTHESTEIVPEWAKGLEAVDEIWTPSQFITEVFRDYTNKEVTTVPISVDDDFVPVRRNASRPFLFLHVGEPSPRKGGSIVLECFQELFGDSDEVQLVFKSFGNTTNLVGANMMSNVVVLSNDYSQQQMNQLYGKVHCLVYPTMGEGGGFIPLEAMATGLPTISTTPWSDYKDFIELPIDSRWVPVSEQLLQTSPLRGSILEPDKDSIKERMTLVYEDYEKYEELYSNRVQELKKQYSSTNIVEWIVIPRLREIEERYV